MRIKKMETEKFAYLSEAHLKPTLLKVLVGCASRRIAERKYSAGSLHDPPRMIRYLPISGPCGFLLLVFG